MKPQPEGVIFSAGDLLPDEWRRLADEGPVRMFNPGLLRDADTWLFAYRVVGSDGLRRIALCRLDHTLRVISGSPQPLSDGFRVRPDRTYPDAARSWFADPRLYRFGQRLFVYWNSGWHEPHNCQFVHELDPRTLRAMGTARELVWADGARQKLEKNWTFFADDENRTYAVYSINPHRILEFSLTGDDDIRFHNVANTSWSPGDYPSNHGGLRGGTPPQPAGSGFLSFCHSVHDGPTGYRYAAAAYRFEGRAPFVPTYRPRFTLQLHNPFGEIRTHDRLNPAVAEVQYPCGAARDQNRWLVSHGINDEYCAISKLADEEIEATLAPLSPDP